MRYIIDILRGANTQKIRSLNHDQLSTFGIGKDQSVDEWQQLGRALLHEGLLSETTDGFPILKLNKLSLEILKRERKVEISVPTLRQPVNTPQPANTSQSESRRRTISTNEQDLDEQEQGLFTFLRVMRKRLADEKGVPPYVVFPDSSLRAMAHLRPQSRDQFAKISGVGITKLHAYFTPFTQAIAVYCRQHNMELESASAATFEKFVEPPVASPPQALSGPSTRYVTLDLYRQGYSIKEIADQRGLKSVTIMSHLADLMEAGEPVDVEELLTPGHYQIIAEALQEVGDATLRPVKDLLGDAYTYDEIRLVRAMLRQSQ
jgi:ATP-dependent DNA helicase RecQ